MLRFDKFIVSFFFFWYCLEYLDNSSQVLTFSEEFVQFGGSFYTKYDTFWNFRKKLKNLFAFCNFVGVYQPLVWNMGKTGNYLPRNREKNYGGRETVVSSGRRRLLPEMRVGGPRSLYGMDQKNPQTCCGGERRILIILRQFGWTNVWRISGQNIRT